MNLAGVTPKRLTADGVVGPTGAVIQGLCGIICEGDGTSTGTVSVYDGPSAAAGTLLFIVDVPANSTVQLDFSCPIAINSGQIFIDFGGTADPDAATVLWK